jgi:capsular exopolysaccharide synthesis family protein
METRPRRPLRLGQWLQIVAAGILGMLVAAMLASLQTPVYQSDAKFFVTTAADNDPAVSAAQAGDFVQQRVKSYPSVVDSQQVMQAVIKKLDLNTTPTDLAKKVTATVPADTVVLQVTVSDKTAAGAQSIAKGFASVLPSYLEQLEGANAKGTPVTVTAIQAPTLPSSPTSPNTLLDLALGLVVGLAIGSGWVLWRASRDTRIRSAADAELAVGAQVIGEIPGGSDLRPAAPGAPLGAGWDSPRSEAYRRLRTSLQFKADGDRAGVVVVASAAPGEGRTTTAANLATAMALAGKRVILIDGDLREPRLSESFGYDGETGLTDVLRGRSRLESEVRLWQADLNLGILPAGATVDNPSELLSSQTLVSVLDTCRRSADVVLIDTPPLLNVTDGSVIAGLSDGALLVVSHGETTSELAAAAAAQLREADTDLHGVIINHVPGALASRFRFRDRRQVAIPEIPAVLTPAVAGVGVDHDDAPDATPESASGNATTSGTANGTDPHVSSANGNASRAAPQYGAAGHDSSAHDASARVTANGNGRHVANGVPTYVTPSNGSVSHMPTANAVATHGVISNSSLPGITAPVIRRR